MEKQRECIVLCGFMGCGKSTIGRRLAKLFACDFLDLDTYLEEKAGCSIPQIFAEQGEAAFRELESAALQALCQRGNLVLAAGGGTLLRPENAEAAHRAGARVVFLDCPFPACYERIKASDRPLVRRNSKEGLEALYHTRLPLYAAACDVRIPAGGPPGGVAAAAAAALGE